MGIQSDVMEAELAQEKAEYAEQQEFKKWKASNKPQAASTIKKTQLKDRIKIERKKL